MNRVSVKIQRQRRIRGKIHGTQSRPRLSVFRSTAAIYAQIINDDEMKTLIGVSEEHMPDTKGTKTEKAKKLGMFLAEKAKAKKITKVVFDKGSYRYHGRVKALAEGVREGGLEF